MRDGVYLSLISRFSSLIALAPRPGKLFGLKGDHEVLTEVIRDLAKDV